MTDLELLRQYAQARSEAAFAELVRRHLDWVYSAALRQVRDRQLAEDVAQGVFIALARQAKSLRRDQALSPWLLRVTRCAAISALRARSRRQRHEQKAAAMRPECITADTEAQWDQVAPLLDEQVLRLGKKDKAAILLRFYERKSLADVGKAMGLSEEAAKKRVQRAVERLRRAMVCKGMTISAGALAVMVGTKVTMAAPAGFANSVVATATAGGGTGTAWLIAKGALKIMAWTNIRVAAGVAVLAVAGAALSVGLAAGSGNRMAGATSSAEPTATQPASTQPGGTAREHAPAATAEEPDVTVLWAEGKRAIAVKRFAEIKWNSYRPSQSLSVFTVTEKQYTSLSAADRSVVDGRVQSLRELARYVIDLGDAATARGDAGVAQKYYTAVGDCGTRILSDEETLAVMKLVGRALQDKVRPKLK